MVWRCEYSCFHSNRTSTIEIGFDIIKEDRFLGEEIVSFYCMAEDARVWLQYAYLRRYHRSLKGAPKLMTGLKVRDDLMDIVSKGKDPLTRLSEAMCDRFGAVDYFHVVHYVLVSSAERPN